MGNGLCVHCGCMMEIAYEEILPDPNAEDTYTKITYECPCCEYMETTYDA